MPPKTRTDSTASDIDATMKEILQQLKRINNRIEIIEEKVDSIESSLNYHTEQWKEVKEDMDQIKNTIPALKGKMEEHEIEKANKMAEIQGVPHHQDESLKDIVTKVAELNDVHLTPVNIDMVYRNKSKKSIIVKFIQTHICQDFIRSFKAKKNKSLTSKELGYKTASKIYINEYLLYPTRQLFHKVREYKKENNFKFAWTINQKVFLRETEGSKAIHIKSLSDL
ncbi:hypothetical protein EB796_020238 [Bugula neritina]|uniref:FP protein C-terminal domain-containing protein n=1 Tax=Bugula neritina TaxID=10212 RepID=A0A7J7J7D1_BUGNE|nr:hypothetical protein EB796_020238 [Bugula neritina]